MLHLPWLYILSFLHQTTTAGVWSALAISCISYLFYIKPQPVDISFGAGVVVYPIFSTSNHNQNSASILLISLYILSFLHQTTTVGLRNVIQFPLYILSFLHQTTTPVILEILTIVLYILSFLHQTTTLFAR